MHIRVILILSAIVLPLSGCVGNDKDGTPWTSLPVAMASEPIPRPEPLSRKGNPDSYEVFGKRYHPIKSSKGYQETGIASWYGTKFHGRLTSNGEAYDVYKVTAAHKTLPLPTYVRVTNLNNDRQLIVRVNDRGPFHEDRIIDLSYAAAVKLGIDKTGTAPVFIEALSPEEMSGPNGWLPQLSVKGQNTPEYFLQVGAFSSAADARQLVRRVARVAPAKIRYEKNHFVVHVGPFPDARTAEQTKTKLQQHGFSKTFVVKYTP
ncbi:MAG: septal ring lytic transglycosylase RlpA family protein [Pseudomonadota bacterium]